MARTFLCIFAAIVAGTGLAIVLALGTASFSAATFKAETTIDKPIYTRVQAMAPTIKLAAGTGFVVGASVIVWLFVSTRPTKKGSDEPGPPHRSEV